MAKRMLIEATHPEETRVVVASGTRLEELDVETSTKKQLKGNIYLAKIVRVEPSLQAAFVDYGGNRHGFLAFSEIHPDYYQIPVSDRKRLLAEERRAEAEARHNGEDGDGDDDDGDADLARPRYRHSREYKIQEVIKRRQIVLVQVVKEERGNKGAALTTFLSLAGRYCVLMPNTARGGGVSRKITSITDRKRLKSMLAEFCIPEGMAVILRTAGGERAKSEIRRDYEYLIKTWNQIRELTLQSRAPALTYEEGSLIKRAIRDLYSRDIEEIVVAGEEAYRLAKDFMKMLTPSHAKKVQRYKDEATMPLFHRYQVAAELDAMHNPVVQLRSGGYVVFSQTEALVAIDVNSGKATRERHIEETALKTNVEAADEIARQLRLRDLAGLIVIDFIDMEETKNNATVEKRLKEALRNDRARIQVGRISPFGLLELSRQRLRPSLMETSFETCTHCGGTGVVRSVESSAVHVLRAIEEEGVRHRSSEISVTCSTAVALYILNQKRPALTAIEARCGFRVFVLGDDKLVPPTFRMDRVKALREDGEGMVPGATELHAVTTASIIPLGVTADEAVPTHRADHDEETVVDTTERPVLEPRTPSEETATPAAAAGNGSGTAAAAANGDEPGRKRRRRRRRRRRGAGEAQGGGEGTGPNGDEDVDSDGEGDDEDDADAETVFVPVPVAVVGAASNAAGGQGDENGTEDEPDGTEDRDAAAEGGDADAGDIDAGGIDANGDDEQTRRRRRGRRGGRRRRHGADGDGDGSDDAVADVLPADAVSAAEGDAGEPVVADAAATAATLVDRGDGDGATAEAIGDAPAEAAPVPAAARRRRRGAVSPAASAAGETAADPAPTKRRATRKRAAPLDVRDPWAEEDPVAADGETLAVIEEAEPLADDAVPDGGGRGAETPPDGAGHDADQTAEKGHNGGETSVRVADSALASPPPPHDAPRRSGWWRKTE